MKTIALIAQKGGAGKTTLALSLAIVAAKAGATSVIIDLDPQATACNWGDRREADTPVIVDAQPARLQSALQKAEEASVDIAIIDTPPRSEQATLAAAKAANLVVVPCRPQIYDLETIPHTKELITLAGGPPILVYSMLCPSAAPATNRPPRLLKDLVSQSVPRHSDCAPPLAILRPSVKPPLSMNPRERRQQKFCKSMSI
jgi:chromosome partitioning protein